jgi:tetratricopeptide (TPR) repeat protein
VTVFKNTMSSEYNEYRILLKKGRYTEAAHFAELQYLEGSRNNPFWLTQQAVALTRAREYKQALHVAEQALLLNSSNSYSMLAAADALRGLKRKDEALRYYEEIIGDPKITFSAQKGILSCLAAKKEWGSILRRVGQWEMPKDSAFGWKVKALAGQKRWDEAIDICGRWLTVRPDLPQALWALTDLEIRRDGLEPVLKKMGRLAKISSRPPVYKEIYASLCKKAGNAELALKQYKELTRTGSDIWNQRQQAFALKKSGKMSEAIPMMEELLKLDPKDIYIHSSYVSACKKSEQVERALKFYEELVEVNPEETTLYGRIRKIKKMLGLEDE